MHVNTQWSLNENQKYQRKRRFMKYQGYWVSIDSGKTVLERTVFDETELDPSTNWKQVWQNQDGATQSRGYVDLDAALSCAVRLLAAAEGRAIGHAEIELATKFDPKWVDDRCEIQSLSCLLDSDVGGATT
jgi:hypothetical protein